MRIHGRRRLTTAGLALAALLVTAGCAGGTAAEPEATFDPDEEATISLSFWGNDVRAAMYDETVAAFEAKYPAIHVDVQFLGPNEYWERRLTEASGGNLPDVFAMDVAYLRQYAENGTLLDLEPYLGSIIQTDTLDPRLVETGVVDGVSVGAPVASAAWGLYVNDTVLDQLGVEVFAGGTWDEYYDWVSEVTAAGQSAGIDVWGGTDPATRILNFELQLRANGGELFTDEGKPAFDEEDLAEFWESSAELRESEDLAPQQRLSEIYPLTGFDAGLTASELTWDNFGSGFLGNLGEGNEISIIAPPITEEGAKDLYLKVSQLFSIAETSDHPAAAATLIDFLINSREVGEIFGSNRGIPGSSIAREAAQLEGIGGEIEEYEASIADRLGDAPAVPTGYGSLYEKFRALGEELGAGTITVDAAVSEFFNEMDVILG